MYVYGSIARWSSLPEIDDGRMIFLFGFPGQRARTFPERGPAGDDFRGGGSRSETENKGLGGRRARTFPERGPAGDDFRGSGSRSETENKGLEERRARTMPEGVTDIGNLKRKKHCKKSEEPKK